MRPKICSIKPSPSLSRPSASNYTLINDNNYISINYNSYRPTLPNGLHIYMFQTIWVGLGSTQMWNIPKFLNPSRTKMYCRNLKRVGGVWTKWFFHAVDGDKFVCLDNIIRVESECLVRNHNKADVIKQMILDLLLWHQK